MASSFGRYQLLRKIGRGGMAEVFLARVGGGDLAKLLAVKRLLPAYSRNNRLVRRLADEARLTVWLTHPNIVQVFDFGRVGESYFIAMEYVDGCDLRSLIIPPGDRPPNQLPLEVALEMGYRILDALRFAHTCTDAVGKPLGIIHRDVSPHNVLISRDGHPKLADFGIARAVSADRHTEPGAVLGKFSYMAPEQARGEEYDHRVDIYAAGATLYQMLTGAKPFPERTLEDAVKNELPPPPSALRPSIGAALDGLVLRALAPRPDDRFASASLMADALLEQMQALGGPAKPHQVCRLVEEVLEQRRNRDRPRDAEPITQRATLSDIIAGRDSLIGEEVTRVRRHVLPEVQGTTDEGAAPGRALPRTEERGEPSARVRSRDLPDAGPGVAADAVPSSAPLSRGMKMWVIGGLASSAALVIFGVGLLVGRATAPEPEPHRCPPTADSARAARAPLGPGEQRVKLALEPETPDPKSRTPDGSVFAKLDAAAEAALTRARRGRSRRRPRSGRARRTVQAHSTVAPEDDDDGDNSGGEEKAVEPPPPVNIADRQRARKLLEAAQAAYVAGDHHRALGLAHQVLRLVPNEVKAWQIVGASSCYLQRPEGARRAWQRVNPERRKLLRAICSRNGIRL
jgi:serine/threonine protein kinase